MPIKDLDKRRKYQREYQKKWRKENPKRVKEISKKNSKKPSRIKYQNEWQKNSPKAKKIRERFKINNPDASKVYCKRYKENNPKKYKEKHRKYYYSIKGVVNILKKKDKAKFGFVNKEINIALVNFVNKRDKECPYCGRKFEPRAEYDHVNPFKPLSKDNIAKACSGCNQSKLNADLLEWMNFKGYKITKKVKDLYEKAYN